MPKVVKYEPSQYNDAVKHMKHINAIVLVFHPQCGHCVQLRPTWDQMVSQAPAKANIIEVNAESMSESPSMSQSEIGRKTEGFPSIMRLKNGRVVESFQQERNVPNMLGFVKKSMGDMVIHKKRKTNKQHNQHNQHKRKKAQKTQKRRKTQKKRE